MMTDTEMSLPKIETAKQINIYRNGDDKFPGKRIMLNKRNVANFDVFLDHITHAVDFNFGAVRRLYTPVNGSRVEDLDQLAGDAYVAAKHESFRKVGYLQIQVCPRRKFNNRATIDIKPVRHSRIQTSGRIRKIHTEPIIIFVHPNGNDLENPHRIQIRPREQGSWEMVLDAIKERVHLRWGGAIRRLCTMDGQPLMTVHEIENNGCYVACGRERFAQKDYAHPKLTMNSPRQERRTYPFGMKLTPLSTRTHSKKSSQNSSVNRTPESNNGSLNNRPKKARRTHARKEEVIREKPVAHKRNGKKEINYDQDPGGVYKAKKENQATRGAQEIQEDRETHVDVPVDQRDAEEVQEEEIKGDQDLVEEQTAAIPSGVEIMKKPSDHEKETSDLEEERIENSRNKTDNNRSTRNSRASRTKPSQSSQEQKRRDSPDQRYSNADNELNNDNEEPIRETSPEGSTRRTSTPPLTYRLDENDSERVPSATSIHSGDKDREKQADDENILRNNNRPSSSDQEQAATTIQAHYRGYRSRRDQPHQTQGQTTPASREIDARENQAATTIQSRYRGYKTRQRIRDERGGLDEV